MKRTQRKFTGPSKAQIVQLLLTEPDVTEPDATADATKPDVTEPDATTDVTAQPDTTEQDIAEDTSPAVTCADDNGGCGDPQFFSCTDTNDGVISADIDECAPAPTVYHGDVPNVLCDNQDCYGAVSALDPNCDGGFWDEHCANCAQCSSRLCGPELL